jgi:myo-inositol-1(or 4)-monophosphatase
MNMLQVLENAARACGDQTLTLQKQGLQATDKDDQLGAHFSTQGDTKGQEKGIEVVRRSYPDEIIIAEEGDNESTIPPDCTVFDPIDGTTAYFNGCREFGPTLCTIRNGQPQYSVIYFPVDQLIITAERGKGCFINGEQIKLQWDRPIDKTMIGTDLGPWSALEVLQGITAQGFPVRSLMAGIYGARAMLMRETGAYYNLNIAKIWDVAAGALSLEEAGGIALNPWGKPLKWDNIQMDWIYAANKELADVVLTHTSTWKGRIH